MAKSNVLKGGEKPPKKKKGDDELPGGQEHLPGMAQMDKIPSIHNLARRAKKASLVASRAKTEYETLKTKLIEEMKEFGIDKYHHGDVTVHVDTKSKLSIQVQNEDAEE